LTELYNKYNILLEEKEFNLNNTKMNDLNTAEKIEYMYNLEKNEIINSEIKGKNLDDKASLIKKDFTIMSNLNFRRNEQEILSVPIQLYRITGSSTTLKDYLLMHYSCVFQIFSLPLRANNIQRGVFRFNIGKSRDHCQSGSSYGCASQ
jgi:hypothetical protein